MPSAQGAAVLLHLSHLRSQQRVAQALASRFPTQASWLEFLGSELAERTFDQFAGLVNTIRGSVEPGATIDFDELLAVAAVGHDNAADVLGALAEELEVDVEDLLVTMVYG